MSRFAAFIRSRLVDHDVGIERVDIAFQQSTVTITYRVRNEGRHRSFLALSRPLETALQSFQAVGRLSLITPVARGWSVEVPAAPVSEFRMIATWLNPEHPLALPTDIPQGIEDVSTPVDLPPIIVHPQPDDHMLVTGLAPSSWREGFVFAHVRHKDTMGSLHLDGSTLTIHFVGHEWNAVSEEDRFASAVLVDKALHALLSPFGERPNGSLGITIGKQHSSLGGQPISILNITKVQDRNATIPPALLWDLSGLMWHGLIMLHGAEYGPLVWALRLQTLKLVGELLQPEARGVRSMRDNILTLLQQDVASDGHPEARAWYERTLDLDNRFDVWRAQHRAAEEAYRTIVGKLIGKRMDAAWIVHRLRAAGLIIE